MPPGRGGGVERLASRAGLDRAGAGNRRGRLRRCRIRASRRHHAVQARRRRVSDRDRGCGRRARDVDGRRRRRLPAFAAIPGRDRTRPDADLRHRLGSGREPLVSGLSRPGSRARRRAALERTLQELGGPLRECHATGYTRDYDAVARTYAPRMAEIGVGCEACHGPGSAHLAWAAEREAYDPTAWAGTGPTGLTIDIGASAEVETGQCASLPFAARGVLRRQSGSGHALCRRIQPRAAARGAVSRGRADP